MRRLALLTLGGAVLLLLAAAPAFADNGPHMSTAGTMTDRCAGCHRLHSAQAPLLLMVDAADICLTCHGAAAGGSALDVLDGVGYTDSARGTAAGALRGGGFQFALVDSANPSGFKSTFSNSTGVVPVLSSGAAVTSTHSTDGSDVTAWGNGAIGSGAGATVQLTCGSCHDPHGNGNYRILRPIPEESGAGTGVTIADAGTKVYTTTNYWQATDTNAAGYIANVSAWCSTCHTRYLATAGDGSLDSGDPIYRYRHRSNDTAPGTPSCIQCHLSHGSNSATGAQSSLLENPGGGTAGLGVGASPASADNRLLRIDERGTCQMCHNR